MREWSHEAEREDRLLSDFAEYSSARCSLSLRFRESNWNRHRLLGWIYCNPFAVGDELVAVDGRSVGEWIKALRPYAVDARGNPFSSDRIAVATMLDRYQGWYTWANKVKPGDTAGTLSPRGARSDHRIPPPGTSHVEARVSGSEACSSALTRQGGSNGPCQVVHRERLLDEVDALLQDAVVRDDVGRVAGHVENRQARAHGSQPLPQLLAAQLRHHHVGE